MIPAFIEVPAGAINGVNAVFTLSTQYIPGSVKVFVNGQLKRGDLDDGWSEIGPTNIQLNEPPVPGDVVQVYYRPL